VALCTQRSFGDGATGFGCCGFPLLSAGDEEGYEEYRAELEAALIDADTVVSECAAFAALYREESSWGEAGDLEIEHFVAFLADRVDFVEPRRRVSLEEGLLHDSCFVGRQLGLYEETRAVLEGLCAEAPEEFYVNREEAPCCGGPSHYHVVAPEASERCAEKRLEEMRREGGAGVICSAATCKKAFDRVEGEVAVDLVDVACRAFGL
jgi:heterodisulfide reductase subunit D